jgi:hypothetical protein
MAKAKQTDSFANMAYLKVTEASAGTLKFAKLQLATEFGTPKKAMIIHRLEFLLGSAANFNASADGIDSALTLSDKLTDISDLSQPEVLVWVQMVRRDFGTAASGFLEHWPIVRDFASLPGGGLIVPANYLYLGIQSTSATAVCSATMRLYYTAMDLEDTDYLQLLEARSILTT